MRPRRLEPGDRFTWRFKTRDYWEALRATRDIRTVEELMALHEPWVTSQAGQVLHVLETHGARPSLDEEGLIVAEVEDDTVETVNAELARFGCILSNELLHTI